jgi:hypothetical protein
MLSETVLGVAESASSVRVQNRAGFFFMATLYVSLTSMSALGWFVTDRRLKWREWTAGLYSAPALFVATQVKTAAPRGAVQANCRTHRPIKYIRRFRDSYRPPKQRLR